MTPDVILKSLSPDTVRRNLAALIAVASDIPGEYWAAENFLADRPDKWRLSFALWRGSELIGYAILSRKAAHQIHLHHLMVSKPNRSQGLGERLVREFLSRCCAARADIVTLKTQRTNSGAIRFYERFGFAKTGIDGDYVVMEKSLDGADR